MINDFGWGFTPALKGDEMVLKHVCSTKSPLQGVGGEEKE